MTTGQRPDDTQSAAPCELGSVAHMYIQLFYDSVRACARENTFEHINGTPASGERAASERRAASGERAISHAADGCVMFH